MTLSMARYVTASFSKLPDTIDTRYYHTDPIGSVRAITDETGAVVIRHDYRPFGEDVQPLTGDPMRFAGKELDEETGLQYFDARYYRNTWGRFTTADPITVSAAMTDPQQWNRYAYARNNPLKWVDPTGLSITCPPNAAQSGCSGHTESVGVAASAPPPVGSLGPPSYTPFGSGNGLSHINTGGMSCGMTETEGIELVYDDSGNCYTWFDVGGPTFVETTTTATTTTGATTATTGGTESTDTADGTGSVDVPAVVAVNPVVVNWIVRLQRMASLLTNWLTRAPTPPVENAHKMHHLFGQAKHGLHVVVQAAGSRQRAYEVIWRATHSVVQGRPDGHFAPVSIEAYGHTVLVEGSIVNGVVRIGSAWIPR